MYYLIFADPTRRSAAESAEADELMSADAGQMAPRESWVGRVFGCCLAPRSGGSMRDPDMGIIRCDDQSSDLNEKTCSGSGRKVASDRGVRGEERRPVEGSRASPLSSGDGTTPKRSTVPASSVCTAPVTKANPFPQRKGRSQTNPTGADLLIYSVEDGPRSHAANVTAGGKVPVPSGPGWQGWPAKVLGPVRGPDRGKTTLVLDLDETLVHSSFRPVGNPDFVIPVEIEGRVVEVFVKTRPFLADFLQYIAGEHEALQGPLQMLGANARR